MGRRFKTWWWWPILMKRWRRRQLRWSSYTDSPRHSAWYRWLSSEPTIAKPSPRNIELANWDDRRHNDLFWFRIINQDQRMGNWLIFENSPQLSLLPAFWLLPCSLPWRSSSQPIKLAALFWSLLGSKAFLISHWSSKLFSLLDYCAFLLFWYLILKQLGGNLNLSLCLTSPLFRGYGSPINSASCCYWYEWFCSLRSGVSGSGRCSEEREVN